MFSHNGAKGTESKMTLCFIEFARWQHWEQAKVAVYHCRLVIVIIIIIIVMDIHCVSKKQYTLLLIITMAN